MSLRRAVNIILRKRIGRGVIGHPRGATRRAVDAGGF
jgi:hypothetical protein